MSYQVFGIRHHGPGSARSLCAALQSMKPDLVLIEGPPEADSIVPFSIHEQMKPPVAILVYSPEEPNRSVYYPFARFSPEWQAMLFAVRENIPVRFMDLPVSWRLGLEKSRENGEQEHDLKEPEETLDDETFDEKDLTNHQVLLQ